ncbi:hypothetical protein BpHYR1_037266 [Brachionus plicatilis]|uniref:Uncharacterized protein n=1 Tax=Brachionus plicatilis TaxID=10195 RepID=A0A3M7P294_BRAPC|nr:hypothetical protein BpHYR1_037266 [Brachionus plicatilis]
MICTVLIGRTRLSEETKGPNLFQFYSLHFRILRNLIKIQNFHFLISTVCLNNKFTSFAKYKKILNGLKKLKN